jgi:hypothetical protein
MPTEPTTRPRAELANEVSAWLVGGGILTTALFPLAIPIIALTAVAALPLLAVPLVAGLLLAGVGLPILLARSLWRLASRWLLSGRHGDQAAAEHRQPAAEASS